MSQTKDKPTKTEAQIPHNLSEGDVVEVTIRVGDSDVTDSRVMQVRGDMDDDNPYGDYVLDHWDDTYIIDGESLTIYSDVRWQTTKHIADIDSIEVLSGGQA